AECLEDRLTPTAGALDTTFGSNGVVSAGTQGVAAVYPDGRILVASNATTTTAQQLLANGSVDSSFTAPTFSTFQTSAVAALPDGSALLAGITGTVDQSEQFIVVKLSASGAIDTNFGNAGSILVGPPNSLYNLGALVVQPDGEILVVGGQQHDTLLGITGGE